MAATKITYTNKSHINPYGTREIQVWDLDMNEIKDAINANADLIDANTASGGGGGGSLVLGETDLTAYRGDRGKIAYDHSQASHAPANANNYVLPFADNSANWNTAYGWGNHAGLYSVLGHVHTFASLTSKPTTLAGYGITDTVISGSGSTNFIPKFTAAETLGDSLIKEVTGGIEVVGDATVKESFTIKNSAGVVQWTINMGTDITSGIDEVLEFKNALGVVKATLDQDGNLLAKGEITAFSV